MINKETIKKLSPHQNSIFVYYAKKIFLLVALPLITVSSIFLYSINGISLRNQIQEKNEFYSKKLPEQLSQLIKNVYSTNNMISSSPEILEYLYAFGADKNARALTANRISTLLSSICLSSDYIDSIYVYSNNNDYILASIGHSSVESFYDDIFMSYYEKSIENYNNVFYRTVDISGEKKEYLTFAISVPLYENIFGITLFNIDCQKLSQLFLNDYLDKFYIIDNLGNIVYSNDSMAILRRFDEYNGKQTVFCTSDSILDIAFEYNASDILNNSYTRTIIVYTITILLVLLIALAVLSGNFSSTLIELISMLEENDINADISKRINLKLLAKNSIEAINSNHVYEKELVAQYNKLKKAQTMILQNQMNPHFLFNTLNVITLADMENNNGTSTKITKIVTLLSNLLRASISSKTYIISLEQELIFVKQYVDLQNIKYNDIIKFNVDVPDSMLEIPVLKLMLQPIVENCITHGILKSAAPKNEYIKINSRISNDNLIIDIINSGETIDKNKLFEINAKLESNEYPDAFHIGLLNVNSRIKLIFGETYGVSVFSENRITIVRITLPDSFDT